MCVASSQRWRIDHNVVTSEKTEWPKQKGETWDDCEKQIQELLQDKLDLDDIEIERAHRVKGTNNFDSNKTRTIACKLLRFKDRNKIFKNANKLKGRKINHDLSKAGKKKIIFCIEVTFTGEGHIAYLNYKTIVCKKKVKDG